MKSKQLKNQWLIKQGEERVRLQNLKEEILKNLFEKYGDIYKANGDMKISIQKKLSKNELELVNTNPLPMGHIVFNGLGKIFNKFEKEFKYQEASKYLVRYGLKKGVDNLQPHWNYSRESILMYDIKSIINYIDRIASNKYVAPFEKEKVDNYFKKFYGERKSQEKITMIKNKLTLKSLDNVISDKEKEILRYEEHLKELKENLETLKQIKREVK